MPKKLAGAGDTTNDTTGLAGLATWQAAGLTLAAISTTMFGGLGVALGAVTLIPVIYVLTRLRAYAPTARSTSDLVGATLGERFASTTGLLQLVAYPILAATAAQTLGLAIVSSALQPPAVFESYWWPTCSVAVVAIAGLLAYLLPVRAVASIAAALALAGLLIEFNLAVAVIARVASGSAPVQFGGRSPQSGLSLWTSLVLAGLGVVGFEIVTTRNRQLRSTAWPLGSAVAVVTGLALTVWLANRVAATGAGAPDPTQFGYIVSQLYGDAGGTWLYAGLICVAVAVLLALTWAAIQVAERQSERMLRRSAAGPAITTALIAMVAVLTVAVCRDWGGVASKIGYSAAMLLVIVYVLAAEANSRIPGDSAVAWWLRAALPTALAAVVLLPLLHTRFAATTVWPVAIAAVLAALAYSAASAFGGRPD